MIKIAHASSDSRGRLSGDRAGDNNGREVFVREWYNRPWTVILRPTDARLADGIADAMEKAAKNDKIGYDQNQRNTLLFEARKHDYDLSKVSVPCETDCSALVAVACISAGIAENALYKSGNLAYTGNLKSRLIQTGKFEAYTASKYRTSDKYLKRGDILLYEGHHVAVALEDGMREVGSTTVGGVKVDYAKSMDKSLARTFETTADLNMRSGAGTSKKVLQVVPKGTKVTCYGYYTDNSGTKWLYVTYKGKTGFCSKKYLK